MASGLPSTIAPLRERIELYRKTLVENDHDPAPKEVLGVYQMYVGEDDSRVKDEAGGELNRYLRFFGSLDKPWNSADYKAYGKGLTDLFKQLNYDVMDTGDGIIFGSPERVVQRIRNIKAGLGLTYMLLEVNFGAMAYEKVIRSIELFGKHVIPHVRDL